MAEKRAQSEPFIENANLFPSDDKKKRPSPEGDARRRKGQQRRRRSSVFQYIAILFMAAFALLLITFLMERRQSQQQIDDLKQSVSAYQTLQGLIDENNQLKEDADKLDDQLRDLDKQLDELNTQLTDLGTLIQNDEKTIQAMHWFWQLNEASVRGRTTQCRELITAMEEANLQEYLPKENITGTDRFSPYERYEEICGLVGR